MTWYDYVALFIAFVALGITLYIIVSILIMRR